MIQITKNDIVNKLKVELDNIFKAEQIFRAGNFNKTNIRIFDGDRKQKSFKDYNYSDIHYEVFFKDREQRIYVELHFLIGAIAQFNSIISSKKFPLDLEYGESVGGTEQIIRLKNKDLIYSRECNDIAREMNIQLKQLKEKIEEIKTGLYREVLNRD